MRFSNSVDEILKLNKSESFEKSSNTVEEDGSAIFEYSTAEHGLDTQL